MATSIDTASVVGKYLSRQTTGTRLNSDADTATENQAVLESIAIALLLNPQAILSIFLNAKNTLQQLITSDIELIDYITAAIGETQNPDGLPSSTADLIDAQTALVELDRIGRIDTNLQAYTRYQNSINNFLNNQLAPLLKRNPSTDFNRSGTEAKQDLFNALGLFTQTHQLFISRLATLSGAIASYNGIDLSRVVHTQTIARVRTSLQQIQAGMTSGGMSNTVAALELMAGNASLQSISNTKKVYDDTIPLSQGLFIGPEPTSAFTLSSVGSPDLSTVASHPHSTSMGADGISAQSYEIPGASKSGCPFVCNSLAQASFNIPAGLKLYVEVTPGPSPGSDGITHYAIPITSGPTQAWTAVIADINAVFGITGPTAGDFFHSDHAIIIFGSNTDTSVRVRGAGPGTFDATTNIFTPDGPSAHEILGFAPDQVSTPIDSFDLDFLTRFIKTNYTPTFNISVDRTLTNQIEITSGSTIPNVSKLVVNNPVLTDFGFTSAIAVPLAMQITDATGAVQDPAALGVLVGSIVHASAFIQTVVAIDGTRILFNPSLLLPLTKSAVRVVAPVVAAAQTSTTVMSSFNGQFNNDLLPLQGLLSPLLTTPSLAQVNDALRAFQVIKTRLSNLFTQLSSIVISEAQEPADATAQSILKTLEERGLDRAQDLLTQCLFSDFFGLTSEDASKSTRFMKSMETVVTTDLPTSTVEEYLPDGNLLAGANPTSILTNKEVP